MGNPVIDVIRARRSIRKYTGKPVTKEVIGQLLSAAVMSPSAMDREPWRFVVITDKAKIKELSDAVKRLTPLQGLAQKFVERMTSREDLIFYSAPLLILIVAQKDYKWAHLDCGILAQTMFLAAKSFGLGSCFIGFARALNNDHELLRSLGVPEGDEIVAPLIFGYQAEEKKAPERKFEDKVLKWFE